jgi:hypothetical protein
VTVSNRIPVTPFYYSPPHPMSTEKQDSRISVAQAGSPSLPSPPPGPSNERPFSRQFLDRGEKISNARKIYIKILIQRTCLIVGVIFSIFSIYWGALWKLPARSLEGWIVVCYSDAPGSALLNAGYYERTLMVIKLASSWQRN